MKKKLLLAIAMVALLVCLFAISASAATPSYKDGEWIYAADGVTKITLRDTDGNPLIWYLNGEELKYVRADQTDESQSVYVKYEIGAGGSGFNTQVFNPQKTLKSIKIYDNGTEIICSGTDLSVQKAVLLNLERLDIDALNGWLFGNKNGCCPLLRGIYLPSTLKGIGQEGFTSTKLVQIWNLENTQLFYMNACSFASTQTLTQEATNYVFKMPSTMTTPISIQNSKVVRYICSPNLDYPEMTNKFQQYFRDCPSLQEIVLPAKANVGFGEETFRGTSAKYIVFITGTEQDAINMRDNTQDRAQGDNAAFKNAEIISYQTYLGDKATYDNATNKVYIVYGYDYCLAFFDGIHNSGKEQMEFESYFKDIKFSSVCQNGCGKTVYNEEKTISALFTWKGFSVSEQADANGCYSVTQGFYVDMEAIKAYAAIKTDFAFGVVASVGKENPISIVDGEVVADSNVIFAPISKNANGELSVVHNYFDIKVTGIDENNLSTQIAFNGYVVDGGEIYYLHAGEMSETAVGSSYNEVI